MKANLASIWMVTVICTLCFSVVAFDCVGQSEFSKKKKNVLDRVKHQLGLPHVQKQVLVQC